MRLLRRFAQRRLDEAYPYVILDARYREGPPRRGNPVPGGVHPRLGDQRGRPAPAVLGVELSNRESSSSWTAFVTGLKNARAARRRVRRLRRSRRDQARGPGAPGRGGVAALLRALRGAQCVWIICRARPTTIADQELRWLYDRRNLKEAQQDLQAWLTRWASAVPETHRVGRSPHRRDV